MNDSGAELIEAAQAEGLLPSGARDDALPAGQTSWIITASSFIGAQLVVLPFIVFLVLLLERWLHDRSGLLIVGAVLLLVAVILLRQPRALFVQQLGFGLLLAGLAFVQMGWELQLDNLMLLGLLGLALAAGLAIRVDWVQRALGFIAASIALLLALWPPTHGTERSWFALLDHTGQGLGFPSVANLALLAMAWVLWCLREPAWSRWRLSARLAALADGVGAAVLLGTAWAVAAPDTLLYSGGSRLFLEHEWSLAGVLLAAFGLAWLARHWRLPASLAHPASRLLALAALGLLLATWVVPRVGIVVLVGAVAAGTGRRRMLWLALAVLLALLAGFYHALDWPLLHKAALLAGIGAGLAVALAFLRARTPGSSGSAAPRRSLAGGWAPGLIAGGLLLALGIVQWDVQGKEQVLAHGQRVYVALAPVDPRSILQGDYMALNFRLSPEIQEQLEARRRAGQSGPWQVLARLDAQGIATAERLARAGESAGPDQVLLPLRRLKHGWTLVTDAYHFPEGQEPRFRAARYGEFRVLPGGRALLAGLADAELHPIEPQP
ncbi:MAG TPA: GDYXXLXY domain-containing protein [Ottowia sp.]|uniref:GDYXXLXY domain-containing protein n=1 Tax=Ottowia sp. TaxID=1898956 RepID=UPI002B8AA824|nr:GDYXXLXY domain-containing protein [Ottowia sp.]HMN21935.1 GDYXXLXY domain-containing protein [Ottowia sp.]